MPDWQRGLCMENIDLKRLKSKDALLLSEVALKAYADHYLHLWHDRGKWYIEKYFSVEKLETELKDENAVFFLAYYNVSPVGFIKLNINAPLDGEEEKKCMELERIYLSKDAAGKGIGRKLVELTFAIGKENNRGIIWLKAMDSSEGPIAFYKKMGFEISGTYKLKHTLMKEELRGMVIMKRPI